MDAFWKERNFTMDRLFFRVYISNVIYRNIFFNLKKKLPSLKVIKLNKLFDIVDVLSGL